MKSPRIFMIAMSLLLWTNFTYAQMNRHYEPIVLTGDTLDYFLSYEISRLVAYTYHAATDTWRMIPFQIDEVDSSADEEDKYFKPEPDSLLGGVLDFDDELVLMARDLGDIAPTNRWIEAADSIRYELEFIDPIDGSKDYVYLYYSNSIIEQIPDKYGMYFDSISDRVSSNNYELGFDRGAPDTTGQMNTVRIKSGSGQDIFDRIKIRLYGLVTFIIPFPVPIDERSIIADSAYAKVGPVRVIRNLNAHFYYDLGILDPFNEPFVQTSFFYPYSSTFSITGIPIDDLQEYADLLYARLSWDMNKNAANMRFYSELNRNDIIVDGTGQQEGINFTSKKNDFDWAMITGSQGTMLNIFYIAALGDSQGIFYYDNNDNDLMTNGDPNDFQPFLVDTADSVAYGDCGYFLMNNISGEEFNFIYQNYFLHPDFSPDSASMICNQTRNPLIYHTQIQKYEPISRVVSAETGSRLDFDLYQNFPNPFNSHTSISFSLAKPGQVSLIIYDVLGKQIKKIVDEQLPSSHYKYTWSGNDDQGQAVSSGLYFCKLKVGNDIVTNKILLIK